MASPATLPTFDFTQGEVYVIRKGTDVIGQAFSINISSNLPTRKIARLGDTDKSTTYAPAEHSANLTVYSEKDPSQLAMILGGTEKPATGGWAGTETLLLSPSATAYELSVDVYDAATTGTDTLQGTWTMTGFKPASLSVPIQADGVVTLTINGECNAVTYAPEAGIGA